jgi:hypothetical protein
MAKSAHSSWKAMAIAAAVSLNGQLIAQAHPGGGNGPGGAPGLGAFNGNGPGGGAGNAGGLPAGNPLSNGGGNISSAVLNAVIGGADGGKGLGSAVTSALTNVIGNGGGGGAAANGGGFANINFGAGGAANVISNLAATTPNLGAAALANVTTSSVSQASFTPAAAVLSGNFASSAQALSAISSSGGAGNVAFNAASASFSVPGPTAVTSSVSAAGNTLGSAVSALASLGLPVLSGSAAAAQSSATASSNPNAALAANLDAHNSFITSALVPTDLTHGRTITMELPTNQQQVELNAGEPGITVPWIVASAQSQPYMIKHEPDVVILPEAGTIFGATDARAILMHTGELLVVTANAGCTVRVGLGTVEVPAGSAVSVGMAANGELSVVSLHGTAANVHLSFEDKGADLVVAVGSELRAGINSLAVSGTSDYAAKNGGENSSPVPGMAVQFTKTDDSAQQYVLMTRLANCDRSLLPPAVAAQVKQVAKSLGATDQALAANQQRLSGLNLRPISMVSPAVKDLIPDPPKESVTELGKVIYTGSAPYVSHDHVQLAEGRWLFMTSQPQMVKLGSLTVKLGRGVLAVVENQDDVVKVRNLCDASSHSVVVSSSAGEIGLLPGQEYLIAPDEAAATRSMKSDNCARRRISMIHITGAVAVCSEFSLVSEMHEDGLVQVACSDTGRAVKDRILKMAAVLQTTTRGRGAYERLKGR